MFDTLITTDELSEHLGNPGRVIVDCRYDLFKPEAGRKAYREAHIPGAVYADLHDDLSGPPITDTGRHPLPSAEALTGLFNRLGIESGTQVVAYDASGGSFAARLWWLLKYMGHETVAVLDGGWQAWEAGNGHTSDGDEANPAGGFRGQPRSDWLVLLPQVPDEAFLVDSRDPARYRGEKEPVDPAAGHIPGAFNRFWQANLKEDGTFKLPGALRDEFRELYKEAGSDHPVFYCGSGVTACHNLLAVEHAGLDPARLYAGSWSEWCSDPARPVATGTR